MSSDGDEPRRALVALLAAGGPTALDQLGRWFPAYRPVHRPDRPFVDDQHQAMAGWPSDGALVRGPVQGFLRRDDALLLYELAHQATGDVLELGSAWGLSTSILCQAVRASGRVAQVTSIEIDDAFVRTTREHLRRLGLLDLHRSEPGDARVVVPRLLRRKAPFGLVFVDHDHRLPASQDLCRHLPALLRPGGFAVFHDFNDERNRTEPQTYGVYPAVVDLLTDPRFVLADVVGCCALVRRES